MIDPHNIPAGKMTREYFEEWVLFGICVANKPARVTAAKLAAFLEAISVDCSPFEKIRYMARAGCLRSKLEDARLGQYTRIMNAMLKVSRMQTDELTDLAKLEAAVGPKTSRMILLYHNPELKIAPLDTHVLKFLGTLGYEVPKASPSGKRYRELELAFIAEAEKRGVTPKVLDEQVWKSYAIA